MTSPVITRTWPCWSPKTFADGCKYPRAVSPKVGYHWRRFLPFVRRDPPRWQTGLRPALRCACLTKCFYPTFVFTINVFEHVLNLCFCSFYCLLAAWAEQVISLQQDMLCHRGSSVPDHRMCPGLLFADLSTGCSPGEEVEIVPKLQRDKWSHLASPSVICNLNLCFQNMWMLMIRGEKYIYVQFNAH